MSNRDEIEVVGHRILEMMGLSDKASKKQIMEELWVAGIKKHFTEEEWKELIQLITSYINARKDEKYIRCCINNIKIRKATCTSYIIKEFPIAFSYLIEYQKPSEEFLEWLNHHIWESDKILQEFEDENDFFCLDSGAILSSIKLSMDFINRNIYKMLVPYSTSRLLCNRSTYDTCLNAGNEETVRVWKLLAKYQKLDAAFINEFLPDLIFGNYSIALFENQPHITEEEWITILENKKPCIRTKIRKMVKNSKSEYISESLKSALDEITSRNRSLACRLREQQKREKNKKEGQK